MTGATTVLHNDSDAMPGEAIGTRSRWYSARGIWALLITLLAVLAGCAGVVYATHWGAGVAGDGHAYVASARNVLAGHWVTFEDYTLAADPKPLEQFPVGYPLMLAAGGPAGMDPVPFARWLNIACLALTLSLMGWLIWSHAQSLWALGMGLAVFTLSAATLRSYSNILTEGVFTTCAAVLLAGLMGAWRNLDRTGIRTLLLCLAALAAGWSCTVRYAGVFLILAGLAAILAWPRMRTSGAEAKPFPTRQRLLGATTFAMVAALLPAAQTLFNLWILGRPTSRALAYHPPPGAKFRQLFDTIGWWLVPEIPSRWHVQLMTWAGVIALALLTLLPPIIALWRWQRRHQRPSAWTVTVWVFAAGYTPFVVVAHTWQDAGIPFNTRIFFPLFFAGWTFAVAAMARALSQPSRGQLRFLGTGAALTVAVLILASVGDHGRQELVRRHNIGWGFEGPRWRSNRLLQTIQNDHGSVKSRPLVGNAGDLVGLTTHRRMGHVPKWFSRPRGQPYRRMPGQYRQLGRWAMSADGRIVYFNAMHDRYDYLSSEAMLAEHLHLKLLVQNRDGRVYAVAAVKGFEDRDYDSDGRPDWENLEEPVRSDVIDHHRARAPLPGDAD